MTDIAEDHGIRVHETNTDSVRLWGPNGEAISDEELEQAGAEFEELGAALEGAAELLGEEDVSIEGAAELLLAEEDLSEQDEVLLSWMTSATQVLTSGAEAHEHSLAYADSGDGFGGGDALFPGGYQQIVEAVARGTDIKLSHTVSLIDYSGR